ncbi:hypothetical protein PTKIN_Ptkin14bG0212300 [Pterospermum kingtungense]
MTSLSRLKQIWRLVKEREEHGIQKLFPSLTDLTMMDCPKLTDATILSERILLKGIQSSKLNFINTKFLTLNGIMGDDHNLIPEVDREGLNELTILHLSYSDSVEYLVDTTKQHVPDTTFTSLVELQLEGMRGLKRLCNGKFPKQFLQNLEKLTVQECPELEEVFEVDEICYSGGQNEPHLLKGSPPYFALQSLKVVNIFRCRNLKSIFSASLIQSLLLLEELWIKGCYRLKTLFTELENDGGETESSSHHLFLPRLTTLCIYHCARLEYVLPITLAQGLPRLETVKVSGCAELKQVFGVAKEQKILTPDVVCLTSLELRDCEDLECLADTTKENVPTCVMFTTLVELVMENMIGLKMLCNGQPPNGFLQNLEILIVEKCIDIFSLYPVAQNLKNLTIRDCEKLQKVFKTDELLNKEQENQALLLSNIEVLQLMSLTELRWILKGPIQYVSLRNLKVVRIEKCNKLESLFSASLIQSLRLLEKLYICDCDKLEIVFAELESEDETKSNMLLASAQSDLPRLQELKLHGLTNLSKFGPMGHHLLFPSLEVLEIKDCSQMITSFTIDSISTVHAKTKVIIYPILRKLFN